MTTKNKRWYNNNLVKTIISGLFITIVGGLIVGLFSSNNPQVNVTSVNQRGGITANNVNIESPERHINDLIKNSLVAQLPNNKAQEIDVTSVLGDQEAYQFAQEIKEYLENKGYKVNGVNQVVFDKPVKGQIISSKEDDSFSIIIGGRE